MPWTTLSDELMGEFRKSAPAGKRYAGFVMGEAGAPRPVYSTVREADRGRTPAAGYYARRERPIEPMMAGPASLQEPEAPELRRGASVTPAEVMYGARASNPRRDVGRLGGDQRDYAKYMAGRLERENPPEEPPLDSMDRARLDMGFAGGMSVRGRAAFAAWDAAKREAGRREGVMAGHRADKQLDRELQAEGIQGRRLENELTARKVMAEETPFEPRVLDIGGGVTAMTTSRQSAVPITKPPLEAPEGGPTTSADGKYVWSGNKWQPVKEPAGKPMDPWNKEMYTRRQMSLRSQIETLLKERAGGNVRHGPDFGWGKKYEDELKEKQEELAGVDAALAVGPAGGGAPAAPAPAAGGKVLDVAGAMALLAEAGGNRQKAEELARQRGYRF